MRGLSKIRARYRGGFGHDEATIHAESLDCGTRKASSIK